MVAHFSQRRMGSLEKLEGSGVGWETILGLFNWVMNCWKRTTRTIGIESTTGSIGTNPIAN
jgi:hypothetical protein